MFRLKLIHYSLQEVEEYLEITNDENGDYLIIDDESLIEKEKVNILFQKDHLVDVKLIVSSLQLKVNTLLDFPLSNGTVRLLVSDIYYIQTYGVDVYLYTHREKYLVKLTLYQLEELLLPYHFARIGKATIVNVGKIVEIQTGFNAKLHLVLENKTTLEVMRSYVKSFKQYLKK